MIVRIGERLRATPTGYVLLVAVGVALFLLAVGLGPDSLPFPPGAEFSDAVVSHWPNALFLQRSVQAGYFPLWRPLLMSGQPFAANPLNKVWYPPQWLVVLLPATLHLNLMIWAHVVLAGVGMRAFGRKIGLESGPAGVIGLAYALTPRLVAATGAGHLDILYALAWFPWLMWAVCEAVVGTGSIWRRGAALGGIGALCFLADIRLSVFIFVLGAAYGTFTALALHRAQRLSALASGLIGIALALGLTAVQWLPLLELAPYLSRNGLTPESAAGFSLKPLQLLAVILPRQPGSHETMLYAGIVVAISVLIGTIRLFRTRRRGLLFFWAATILLAALYALGDQGPLWPILVRLFPPLLWLRVPPRIWIVAVFALVVLAGFGVQVVVQSRQGQRTWLVAAIGGLIVLDLLWTDMTLIQGRHRREWLDVYQPVAQALLDSGATRVYSPSYSLPQQAAAYWNIQDFGGVDPFQLRGYVSEFEAATGTSVKDYSITLPPFEGAISTANQNAKLDADRLGQWNVSHVLSAFPVDTPGLVLHQRLGDLYLYENTRRPPVKVSWDGPNCVSVAAPPGVEFNVAAWAPGWQSTLPVNSGQSAIVYSVGDSLHLTSGCYGPSLLSSPSLFFGTLFSSGALCALGAVVVLGRRRG